MKKFDLSSQNGSVLLEALIAILIFSIGILSLVALQAFSIKSSIDAKYRADAAYFTNQIISQMWLDRSNIDNYAHNTGGSDCTFTGTASSNSNVTSWLTDVAKMLPGAGSSLAQIKISTPSTGVKQIQVMLCWKGPQDTSAHNFVATAQINQ